MTQNVSTDIDQLRLGQINTFPVYDQKNEDNAFPAQDVKTVDLKIPRRKVRQRKRRYQRKCHDRRQYKKHRQNWLIIYLEQQRNTCRGGIVVATNVKDDTAMQNIHVDRVIQTQRTRGLFTVRFSVHGLIQPGCNPGNLQWGTLTPSQMWVQSSLGQLYIPLRTNGIDGCSLHALLGSGNCHWMSVADNISEFQ